MESLNKEFKDQKRRSLTLKFWCSASLFFIITFFSLNIIYINQSYSEERLAVFIVMDASGSLKKTDPRGARKIAANIFTHLLEPNDMVSIIEFEKDARVLLPLVPASQKKKITEVIEKIGQEGEFTDYRKALEKTLEGLKQVKENGISKMVVFFTDGILEPDLTDSIYYPYNKEYLEEIRRTKQISDRQAIAKRYTDLVTPKTERIIFEEILPQFAANGGEIYSIALTNRANTKLLKDISDKTTRHSEEKHFFIAESFTDLTKEFIKALSCRRPIFIAFEKDGFLKGYQEETVFLDPYIDKANFNVVSDQKGSDIKLINPSGQMLPYSNEVGGVFYDFSDVPFTNGKWKVQLKGEGPFTLLAMAKSNIEIEVKGLRKTYKCKEPVQLNIQLLSKGKYLAEKDFGSMNYLLQIKNPTGRQEKHILNSKNGEFKFLYHPNTQGIHHLLVELKARDRQNNEILPRPGKELTFDVEKDVIISPKEIFFGNYWRGGKDITKKIDIESCIEREIIVETDSSNIISSNKHFEKREKGRIPQISLDKIVLKAGDKRTINVNLSIPKKIYRGDYKGEIRFFSGHIEPKVVTYRFHVYTFWEILKFLFPILIILGIFILGYFVYIWGYLGSPFGVLVPVSIPSGSPLLRDIKLSQVRRNLLSRWFNWRRNRLRIKRKGGDINLSILPPGLEAELSFYRWGRAYIKNQSLKESTSTISVEEPGMGAPFVRRPGQSLSLRNKSIITLGDYKFRYEHK